MTEDEVFDRLIAFLKGVNTNEGLIKGSAPPLTNIVRAHQNGPRPDGAYATVNILSQVDLREANCDLYRAIEIAAEERIVHDKVRALEWLIRVEIFAQYPIDAARLFQSALRSAYSNVLLSPLVVRRVDEATRAPIQVQNRWEGRANLDFTVAAIVTESTLTEVIEEGRLTFGAEIFDADISYERTP